MKIAVVSTFFMPGTGYQEENIANNLVLLGHEIKVFTSVYYAPGSKKSKQSKFRVGISEAIEKYQLERIRCYFNFGNAVLCKGLKQKVLQYKPDSVIVIGVGTLFPFSITGKAFKHKRIVFFGNNIDMKSWKRRFNLRFFIKQKIINRFLYTRAIVNCEHLVLYTPSTKSILKGLINKRLHRMFDNKEIESSLGFDSSVFYFDQNSRTAIRQNHHINKSDFVLITSTKVQAGKMIEKVISAVDHMHRKGIVLYYVIIGFLDDPYSDSIRKIINRTHKPEYFICLPFLPQQEINAYYSAADAGIWLQAAISIQQSMATGLEVLLQNRSSVNHLIENNINGRFIDLNKLETDLESVFDDYFQYKEDEKLAKRLKRIHYNQKFNYQHILSEIFAVSNLKYATAKLSKEHDIFLFQRIIPYYRISLFKQLVDKLGITIYYSQERTGDSLINKGDEIGDPNKKLKRFFIKKTPTAMFQWILPPLLKHRPNIVITEFALSYFTFWFLILLRNVVKYKLILWSHGIKNKELHKPFMSWKSRLQLWGFNQADAVILYSEKRKKLLQIKVKNAEKLFVAYNTLDTEKLIAIYEKLKRTDRKKLRNKLKFKSEWNIIFIARVTQEKRLDMLIEAVKSLPDEFDINLHIVGDGPVLEHAKRLAKGQTRIFFHGAIYDIMITSEYLFASDMMIMPGAVGLSVVHAMAMGCPVITSKPGINGPFHGPEAEYIIDGKNGMFCEFSSEGFKKAIIEMVSKPLLLKKLSEGSLKTIQNSASTEKFINGFSQAIKYVAS